MIKEFNICEPRVKLPPSVEGKGAAAPAALVAPVSLDIDLFTTAWLTQVRKTRIKEYENKP